MAASDPFAPSDPLGEALHLMRMNGAFYCRSEFTAPCGLETGADDVRWLQPGDLALVTRGEGHTLRSERARRAGSERPRPRA